MQLSRNQSSSAVALPIVSLLWLGFGAAGAWALAQSGVHTAAALPQAISLLTLFVAATSATFSLRYMRADKRSTRFFGILGMLVAAVLTFLFAGNLLVLGVAWCVSGWLLAMLIGHADGWQEAQAAASRARWTFLVGDLALLAAFGLLSWQAGTMDVAAVLTGASSTSSSLATNAAALLLVIAAAARCGLPPFSGWLLSSMTAPTPVSALMHAGLVNAGGFLMISFAPVLEAAPIARMIAIVIGLSAAIFGIGIMMVRPDVKRSLAASTVSQMGFMIMSCGLGAYAAALWHIIAHGLFKAWLFLGSGSTIGIKTRKSTGALSGRAALVISITTIGGALLILVFNAGDASLVPLLLGVATAISTLAAALGGEVPIRAKMILVLTLGALIAFHGGGLALAAMAIGPNAPPLLPDLGLLALLIVFLGGWTWQQQRVATARGLPLPLYVFLINAGTLPAAGKGEVK